MESFNTEWNWVNKNILQFLIRIDFVEIRILAKAIKDLMKLLSNYSRIFQRNRKKITQISMKLLKILKAIMNNNSKARVSHYLI